MKCIILLTSCCIVLATDCVSAQENIITQAGKNMRIQKLVRDVLGKTVTLNFKNNTAETGILIRANGIECILEIDGEEVIFQTETVRSFSLKAGLTEGILVALSAGVLGGFGLGAAALSFPGLSGSTATAIAAVFGLFGGWLGYESFFQDVEIEFP